jgi:hypothetical protein
MTKSFYLTCKKVYYTPFFNTASNLNYEGPYPEPKIYGAVSMSVDERAQILECYEEQKGKLFRNKGELLVYCMDDVNVLRRTCCAFRNWFLKLVKMDSFREAITISSICNKVFLTMLPYLKTNTVDIIPRGGYRMGDRPCIESFNG